MAKFATARHGFGNSDGGFGVTYPQDLDDYDREVDGAHIKTGDVRVYGFWGPPDGYEVDVSERHYLTILAAVLAETGLIAESSRVRDM